MWLLVSISSSEPEFQRNALMSTGQQGKGPKLAMSISEMLTLICKSGEHNTSLQKGCYTAPGRRLLI